MAAVAMVCPRRKNVTLSFGRNCALERQLDVELHTARRSGGDGVSEERRAEHSDISLVVAVVDDVEGAQADGERDFLFLVAGENELARGAHVNVDVSGPVERVPRHAGGTIVENAVLVGIGG